jgi:hypothetical protein
MPPRAKRSVPATAEHKYPTRSHATRSKTPTGNQDRVEHESDKAKADAPVAEAEAAPGGCCANSCAASADKDADKDAATTTTTTCSAASRNKKRNHEQKWNVSCDNLSGREDLWLRLPADESWNNPERHKEQLNTVVARDGAKGRIVPRFTVCKGERATLQFEAYCIAPDDSLDALLTFGVGASSQLVDETSEAMYEPPTRDAILCRTDLPSRFSSDFTVKPPMLTIYEGLRPKKCERQRSRPGGPSAAPYTACIDWKAPTPVLTLNLGNRFVGGAFEMERRQFSCNINHGDAMPKDAPVLYFQFYLESWKDNKDTLRLLSIKYD